MSKKIIMRGAGGKRRRGKPGKKWLENLNPGSRSKELEERRTELKKVANKNERPIAYSPACSFNLDSILCIEDDVYRYGIKIICLKLYGWYKNIYYLWISGRRTTAIKLFAKNSVPVLSSSATIVRASQDEKIHSKKRGKL